MRYAVYLLSGDVYEDLERTIEAGSPREAAQMAFDQLDIHSDEQFPQLMVVPAEEIDIFTRDDMGCARTMTEDLTSQTAKGPRYAIVAIDGSRLGEYP